MTILKSVIVTTVLLGGGSSLAMAQNGPAAGRDHPVAGGAGGGWGWYDDSWYGGAPYGYHPRLYDYYQLDRHRMVPTVPPNH